MPPLLENAHATALLSRVMLRWPGEWLNGSGWPSAITTAGTVLQNILWKHLILQGQDMPTRSQLHILQLSAFLSYVLFEPDHAVISEQWQTQMEIEEPRFKHWALVLDFQLCVLRLVRRIRCGDYRPWNVRLNVCPGVLLWNMWTIRCQTFSSLNFFCRGTFVVWKPKKRKRRGDLYGLPIPSSGTLMWTEALYLQTGVQKRCKCFKVACCAQPCAYATRQGFLTGKGHIR